MASIRHLTTVIERKGDAYVALCPELDIASQGSTIDESQPILRQALERFFEEASPSEIQERSHTEVYITRIEIAVG